MELQKNTHHVYRLMYHFVWIPKYRHKVFEEPYQAAMKAMIEKIGYDYDIDIVGRSRYRGEKLWFHVLTMLLYIKAREVVALPSQRA